MTDTLNPVTCKNGHVSKLYPSGYCAQCNIEAVKRYNQRHPDRVKAYQKQYNASPAGRTRSRNGTRRQVMKGLPEVEAAPGHPCEICEKPIKHQPYADHNHATGYFRGWLCRRCNTGLSFLERPEFVQAAFVYLRRKP